MEFISSCHIDALPVKSWCPTVEEGAIVQAHNLSRHPVLKFHVALMPDCHQGYGMPIGGVVAAHNAIIPNAVGVDIGCGMQATETNLRVGDMGTVERTDLVKQIIGRIRQVVPVGFEHQKEAQTWSGFDNPPELPVVLGELAAARKQLGTLGGGNHFIELQQDQYGKLWIMLHSGSRNFGYKIAEYYHQEALRMNELSYKEILPDPELAFLSLNDNIGHDYLEAMSYALAFARANRGLMMQRILGILYDVVPSVTFTYPLDVHHNYAALENHFGEEVWIHRKGATSAAYCELGIIPGSMGTKSYIVRGLGNPDSFRSCSHGAGRKMSRSKASKTITLEEADKSMEGIVFGRWNKDRKKRGFDFGEAPQAYKDIDEVMENQKDLVEIEITLTPLGVVKG